MTEVYPSEWECERAVKSVSTLSKRARQDTDEAHRPEGGTRVALTSLLRPQTNEQVIKAGSCPS